MQALVVERKPHRFAAARLASEIEPGRGARVGPLRLKNVAEPAQVGNLPMFYTTPQFFAMNRKKYDSLPADLRKVIDNNGGEKVAGEIGRIWDESAVPVRKVFRDRGNTIVEFQAVEMERWVKAAQPAYDEWIKFVGERGYDGKAVLEEARAVIKEIALTVKR